MVLESLINPFTAEKRPWEMFFVGFLYNTIALFLSWWIFPHYASLIMVFLTVISCIPLVYSTIKKEEKYDMYETKEYLLIKEHGRVLLFLMFLFLGVMFSVVLWYVVLPTSLHQNLFGIQSETIESINSNISGNVIDKNINNLFYIFSKNLRVLMFCWLFSLFYCFGSIFILVWNASVVGVAIGNFIRINLSKYSSYFSIVPLAIFRYMTHGFFEIASYFIAGLAGGIISIAVTNHDFGTKKFEHILLDSADLVLLSIILLFIAALIEVFITPTLFPRLF
jgi:stage II sporulation protein M